MPGVPLRYPWRGSLTWPLKGDPRRYSTFPPYTDGHPLEGIGGKVVEYSKAFVGKLFSILRFLLWNFPAGLVFGTVAGIFICRNGHIKVLEPSTVFLGAEPRPLKTQSQSQGATSQPIIDVEWETIGANLRRIVISKAEGAAVGLGSNHVQVSEEHGGGYVVDILGVDHLECLGTIRKALHSEEHHSRSKLAHCLETIRQQLTCRVDLGVRGQRWWNRSNPQPGPDLGSEERSCHDFHAIRVMLERRQIPEEIPAGFYLQPLPHQILDIRS